MLLDYMLLKTNMKAHEKALEFKPMYYILLKFQQVLHILQVDDPDGVQMSYL